MIESVCGVGAVNEVEREVRARVEFDVTKQMAQQKKQRKMQMNESKEKARALYQKLTDRLNMRCPRCSSVFHDYDGCNALTCWNTSCRAAICAICLKDCGNDAHAHVGSEHQALFDKGAFETARKERELSTVDSFIREIANEPYEVQELVKIEYEKSQGPGMGTHYGIHKHTQFLHSARLSLRQAVRDDRLSLLSNGIGTAPHSGFSLSDISPRNAVPNDYRLSLKHMGGGSRYRILLQERKENGLWVHIPLPDDSEETVKDDQKVKPKVDSISNLRSSLQCAVIAFRGCRKLYQSRVGPNDTEEVGKEEIRVEFLPINDSGGVEGGARRLIDVPLQDDEFQILGLNPNRRMLMMEQHVEKTDDSLLLFPSLKSYVGGSEPKRVLSEISLTAPETFKSLNREQQRVAHPMSLTSAMEVAGPPGT